MAEAGEIRGFEEQKLVSAYPERAWRRDLPAAGAWGEAAASGAALSALRASDTVKRAASASESHEVFVADEGNLRVAVYDANTGAYKRMWAGYGEAPPAKASGNPRAPSAR